jgi:DNA-binding CsgD family transcriptional regulator
MARVAFRIGGSGWQGGPPPASGERRQRDPAPATVIRAGSLMAPKSENDSSPGRSDQSIGDAPGAQALLAALDTALDAIAPAAFVVARSGRILRANAVARALLEHEGVGLRRALVAATSRFSAAVDTMWELTPLRGAATPVGFLAIRRPPSREIAIADALRIVTRRWKLTTRQLEVLGLVARGLTNDVIAESLRIGKGTVEFHLSAIFDKAGVCNRATLIVRMYEVE